MRLTLPRLVTGALLAIGTAGRAQNAPRNVKFTTTGATWASVDVSPNGATIVFDLLGDIYTVPLAGGKETRVSSGRAFDAMPPWSPDGRWIVYSSDKNGGADLWIVRPDGSGARAIVSQDEGAFIAPVWSHDGKFVLAGRGAVGVSPSDIMKYGVDSASSASLYADSVQKKNRKSATPFGLFTTRDGKYVYYAGGAAGGGVPRPGSARSQVHRRSLDTGKEETVTEAPGGGMRPTVSYDGRLLVYASRHDGKTGLRLRNLATDDERWLLYPIDRDNSDAYMASRDHVPGFSFTPDGREVVISYGGKIHRVDVATGKSRPIAFTADVDLDVGPRLVFPHRVDTGAVRARIISSLALSPDSKRLAFSAFDLLYTMDLPNGKPRLIRPDTIRGLEPVWAPDGRR